DGRRLYHRGQELSHAAYEPAADALFETFSSLLEPLTTAIRERFPIEPDETDRAWKSATRAKALDLLRGLLPAGTLTNLGLFGNGRAFEYLITKMSASELPECRALATARPRPPSRSSPTPRPTAIFTATECSPRPANCWARRLAMTCRRRSPTSGWTRPSGGLWTAPPPPTNGWRQISARRSRNTSSRSPTA